MAMRAVWITRPGGPEALEVRETADPEPGPGQVRIRVRAAGLTFADVMAAQGLYPDAPRPPTPTAGSCNARTSAKSSSNPEPIPAVNRCEWASPGSGRRGR